MKSEKTVKGFLKKWIFLNLLGNIVGGDIVLTTMYILEKIKNIETDHLTDYRRNAEGLMGMTNNELIELAQNDNWDVCVYGLGFLGNKLYKEIPNILGLNAVYYCDSDNQRVDEVRFPGMLGVYKSELIKTNHPTLVLIMVDDPYDKEIKYELSINERLYPITIRELAGTKLVLSAFYGDSIYSQIAELQNIRIENTL